MGRQTIWGGAGKPPSREVMAAAAKAARQEMMQRIRENKAGQGERGAKAERPAKTERAARPPQQPKQHARPQRDQQPRNQQPRDPQQRNGHVNHARPEDRDDDRMPRNIDPLKTNLPGRRDMTGVKRVNGNGQPDPTRTSIDSMGASRRDRNRSRGNGGGGGFGQRTARFGR
jgi:ATP-dependent RNA helicase RhlE